MTFSAYHDFACYFQRAQYQRFAVFHHYCQNIMAGWEARCIWERSGRYGRCEEARSFRVSKRKDQQEDRRC